jgi:outer membrane protein
MKKTVLGAIAVMAMSSLTFTSCNKQQPQNDSKAETAKVATDTKIAYIEVDSIMTQYQYCKEYSAILQKKGENIQRTLANKQQQLQAAANNFQQNLQQNKYTQQQAEGIQAGLQKQNADLQALNQRLSGEFQAETEKYNAALRDSIQHFLAVYNKDKKFTLILSKAGDNILYADKSCDITKEVIAGLNKAYRPAKKGESASKK